MIERLSELLKKYVSIFINEYANYLSKEQLETLRKINFNNIIELTDLTMPFGITQFNKIYLSNNELINNLKEMPNYNTIRTSLDNKNLSSYLKYMCDNGYDTINYYEDILMYFVFLLVIKNKSSFIYGLINQEMHFLSIKYSLKVAYLYAREDRVVSKLTPVLKIEGCRKVLFMDKVSAFKYLNDNFGYRYAKLVDEISLLMDKENEVLKNKDYGGINGFLNYVDDYDHISYGDVYNHILDFEVKNSL